jgi:hypothetical protein
VQLPTYALVINLRIAKALSLNVPPGLLNAADDLVEVRLWPKAVGFLGCGEGMAR